MSEKPKKSHYINAEEQRTMLKLIEEYLTLTEDGKKVSYAAQRIMDKLFTNYFDRIISGVIYNKKYSYHRYAELEDLMNEGRIAIYESIVKRQWKEKIPKKDQNKEIVCDENGEPIMVKGASIFSFLTTVAQKNLLSYTFNMNKDRKFRAFQEIETLFDNDNMKYNEQHDERILIPEIFKELKEYFKDRHKLYQLSCLLEEYFHKVGGVKFVKRILLNLPKLILLVLP